MKKIVTIIATVLTIITLIQACKKDTPIVPGTPATPASSSKYASFQLFLTDAAGPYEEVNVEVLQVEIHSTGSGWKTDTLLHPGIYNLLNFSNGIDTIIFKDSLLAGKITQIRLILGPNNTVKVGGVTYPLSTPSAEQSGLKLQVHQDVVPGITYAITLDFDAAKSIIQTGNGTYKLKPVLRTFTKGIDGAISGKVSPAVITPVFAIMGTDTTGGFTNANGEFLIRGLAPGTYSVLITPAAPYSNKTISGVAVTAGQITNTGITNL